MLAYKIQNVVLHTLFTAPAIHHDIDMNKVGVIHDPLHLPPGQNESVKKEIPLCLILQCCYVSPLRICLVQNSNFSVKEKK